MAVKGALRGCVGGVLQSMLENFVENMLHDMRQIARASTFCDRNQRQHTYHSEDKPLTAVSVTGLLLRLRVCLLSTAA
jgi:hypothetical protein